MPNYMLLMYQPAEGGPRKADGSPITEPEDWAVENKRWATFTQDLKDTGALVSNHGLGGTEAATTVRVRDGETNITDGPFAETKEYFAGYFLIEVDDLDAALAWAARVPNATYGSVEVRPLWG